MLAIFPIFPIFSVSSLSATADEGGSAAVTAPPYYACALSYDVYLYADENLTTALFSIPYTYYVKVLSCNETDVARVEYGGEHGVEQVEGYCPLSKLYAVDFTPARPFLNLTLTATYTLEGNLSALPNGDFSTLQICYAYYGDYAVGGNYFCYVLSHDGKWGYLPKPENFSYELNADIPPPSENEAPDESPQTLPVLQIIFAVTIAALTVAFVCVLVYKRGELPAPTPEEDLEFSFDE